MGILSLWRARRWHTALLFGLGLLVGCRFAVQDITQVPASPSYAADIHPIYEDHCILCHGSPPDHGAPDYFRLDVYDDGVVNGRTVQGAAGMIGQCLQRIQSHSMPPAAQWCDGLGPNAQEALQRWAQNLQR